MNKNYYFHRICKEAETKRKNMKSYKCETTLTVRSTCAKTLPCFGQR